MQMKPLSGFTPSCIIHLYINNKWPPFYAIVASDVYSTLIFEKELKFVLNDSSCLTFILQHSYKIYCIYLNRSSFIVSFYVKIIRPILTGHCAISLYWPMSRLTCANHSLYNYTFNLHLFSTVKQPRAPTLLSKITGIIKSI